MVLKRTIEDVPQSQVFRAVFLRRISNFGLRGQEEQVKFLARAASVVVLAILLSGSVHAAALIFDETLVPEMIRISANDFEYGLSINGVLFQSGLGNPAVGDFPETDPIAFLGAWINPSGGSGIRTIYLIEAGTID